MIMICLEFNVILKKPLNGEDEAMMNDYAFEMNVVWQLFICLDVV